MKSVRYFCSSLKALRFLDRYFLKVPGIKSHENPCNGSRVETRGQTDGRTDMTKLTSTLCDLSESA